ncbi:MAG: hypothetical protein LQ342_005193 [Letrouitia transgressa]|nr:MAG: hypothetical protein LQ342_005193 [Letrouitia transgressa]
MSPAHPPVSPIVAIKSKASLSKTADLNVKHVILGDILFGTWYPSFYPEELVGRELERLYNLCPNSDVRTLGRLIYTRDGYSIYEVDGEEHQLFSQNLSLFAKLFLDNKSVFFDVASFNYYLLVQDVPVNNPARPESRITGFFSKEKISWDNNNLACILVFPPWQRKGFGKILMGISYQLSKLEGRVGGPEKPLSELGRVGYARFWEARLAAAILKMRNKATVSLQEISDRCWMLPEDVITTLNDMAIVGSKPRSDGGVAVSKAKVRDWVLSNNVDLTPPIDEECFAAEYVDEFDAG